MLQAPKLLDLAGTNHFKLAGGVQKMSGSPSATRNSVASIPLIPEFRCFGSGGCAVWITTTYLPRHHEALGHRVARGRVLLEEV
jgi:hypothetical protein